MRLLGARTRLASGVVFLPAFVLVVRDSGGGPRHAASATVSRSFLFGCPVPRGF